MPNLAHEYEPLAQSTPGNDTERTMSTEVLESCRGNGSARAGAGGTGTAGDCNTNLGREIEIELNYTGKDAGKNKELETSKKFSHQHPDRIDAAKMEFDPGCYFADGKRYVDYVLVFEDGEEGGSGGSETERDSGSRPDTPDPESGQSGRKVSVAEKRRERRVCYQNNLETMGLELEEHAQHSCDQGGVASKIRYVLVHAPFAVLEKQAAIMGVKLPVQQSDVAREERRNTVLPGVFDRLLSRLKWLSIDDRAANLLDEPDYFTRPYSSDRRKIFLNWDNQAMLFPSAERSRMVHDLLRRAHYAPPNALRDEYYRIGIGRLLSNGTYTGAFPLHHEMRPHFRMLVPSEKTHRELLYTYWASWRSWYKYQPLDSIKRYFGTKMGLYFAWLGYYTKSLFLAAFVGVLSVVYGLMRMSEDHVSNDICGSDGAGARLIVCPQCTSKYCDMEKLQNSCIYSKVSFLFDNGMTVIFAALMSIWATLFLEGWKRYHAEVAWKWGLMDFMVEEDTVRPEFQFRVKTTRVNPVTEMPEPYLTRQKKVLNCLAAGSTVLFFISLVLAVVFGMVVYHTIALNVLSSFGNDTVDAFAFILVSCTSASINLCIIMSMNMFYNRLAARLTEWECPRTQADYDNSYTFKVFLFQFVNYYSSLFYIAFFKGVFAQVPGGTSEENVKVAGWRLVGCNAAGCFAELVIQLAIIMCGKQFTSAFMELGYPILLGFVRRWRIVGDDSAEKRRRRLETLKEKGFRVPRWESDYMLQPAYDQYLFDEYLEMVLQFGFCTLFVAAFPLAPLFALINNIMEIRLDAFKFLTHLQRPMPQRATNIGVWYNILDTISRISVTINALVIAFTSDFVPKMVYWFGKGDMDGYVESSLSYFDVKELDIDSRSFPNATVCRYRGYRDPPCSLYNSNQTSLPDGTKCDNHLPLSMEWWHLLAAKLIFVLVFEHLVFMVKKLVDFLIPDVPSRIFVQQQREKYLARKALLDETRSSTSSTVDKDNSGTATNMDRLFAMENDRAGVAFQPGSFEKEDSIMSYETAYGEDDSKRNITEM